MSKPKDENDSMAETRLTERGADADDIEPTIIQPGEHELFDDTGKPTYIKQHDSRGTSGVGSRTIGLEIGELFLGKYKILSHLGAGAFGSVYHARHVDLGSDYAIKIMHGDADSQPGLVQRFKREARACALVEHPNAVRVFDCGEAEGLLYIVMEYLRGEPLSARIAKRAPLDVDEAIRLGVVVCDVLATMQKKGLIHRDLKPGNILLHKTDSGEVVKVLDFGIAKLTQSAAMSEQLTQTGSIIGTPAYMSPEQCQGHEVDGRADIYSLGAVLYHMLSGKLPVESENVMSLMYLVVNATPKLLTELRPSIPENLATVVARMLAKSPDDRFQTPEDCARALSDSVSNKDPSPFSSTAMTKSLPISPQPTVERSGPPPGVHPLTAPRAPTKSSVMRNAVLGSVGVVLIGGAAWAVWPRTETNSIAAPVPAPSVAIAPGPNLVLIPGGSFELGTNVEAIATLRESKISPDESPAHIVSLQPYYLSIYEVTNEEYAAFVASGHDAPLGWTSGVMPKGAGKHPVTGVSWNDASEYCAWMSKQTGSMYRLPTEAEWEHAARGVDGRLFPWGDFWDKNQANAGKEEGTGSPLPINQAPNNSSDAGPFGVFALGGNVSEWTGSSLASYPGSKFAPKSKELEMKVFRGGHFNSEQNALRTTYRAWLPPNDRQPYLGFRVAVTPASDTH